MNDRCEKTRALLVAHTQGELVGLDAQLVHLHVENCAACGALAADLTAGLNAARTVPPIDDDEFLSLAARATAVAPPRLAMRILLVPMIAVFFASVMLTFVGPRFSEAAARARARAHADDRLLRSSPSPGVRMLTDSSFVGTVAHDDILTSIELRRGFVVLAARDVVHVSFASAKGGARVITRDAGARFSVDARGGHTVVEVASGAVRVVSEDGELERDVVAGERVMMDGSDAASDAASSHATALLDDAQLVAFLMSTSS